MGAVALVAVVVVVLRSLSGGRPEEVVAGAFVDAMLAGDAAEAYALTDADYRVLVHASDLEALAGALADLVGDRPSVRVLGSERTPEARPPTSLVGYRGSTAAGRVEGVVTLVRSGSDGAWRVRDVSYRFPEADGPELQRLAELTRALNEALADRASALTSSGG